MNVLNPLRTLAVAVFVAASMAACAVSSGTASNQNVSSSQWTHLTAPTQKVTVGGITYAYRRFGKEGGTPLIFLNHFRGGLDNWDPLLTDGFARDRTVILFDNAGVSSSTGEVPNTIEEMGEHVATFVKGLGLKEVDVLGFSIGGYVAQAFTLSHPELVRKLVLIGTGPRAGDPATDPKMLTVATRPVPSEEDFLYLFFGRSDKAQAAGRAFWQRRNQRTVDVDPPSSVQAMKAQITAGIDWRKPHGERFAELKRITQPVLVANGANDIMIPTTNSYYLAGNLPNAQLIIYPDAGHAPHAQYPELFLSHARLFLDGNSLK
jgi:pimeloyl-ACP methyl ester carboxylesterase